MSWNPEQQRLLHALGHELMVHGTQWPVVRATENVGAALAAMPSSKSIAAKAAPTKAAPANAVAAVAGNKLVEAIKRAAGGNDVSVLIDDIGRLRNEPALKRALWPRLRALRRSH